MSRQDSLREDRDAESDLPDERSPEELNNELVVSSSSR